MRRIQRTLTDEVRLTELAFDTKDLVTFEISSSIFVAEKKQEDGLEKFKCFMDNKTREFFIEIHSEETLKFLSRSTLLNALELAEEAGAVVVYICLKKLIPNKDAYLKNFLFLGFEQLSEEDQKQISMTTTHNILKYSTIEQEEL